MEMKSDKYCTFKSRSLWIDLGIQFFMKITCRQFGRWKTTSEKYVSNYFHCNSFASHYFYHLKAVSIQKFLPSKPWLGRIFGRSNLSLFVLPGCKPQVGLQISVEESTLKAKNELCWTTNFVKVQWDISYRFIERDMKILLYIVNYIISLVDCSILCDAIRYFILYCTLLYDTILYYMVLYCTIQSYNILY